MEWIDDGIVVALARLGEQGRVVTLVTRREGRHAGLLRTGPGQGRESGGGSGGGSGRAPGAGPGGGLQLGDRVRARWRGRLDEHLGTLVCETAASVAGDVLDDAGRLAALSAAAAIAATALPERAPNPRAFAGLEQFLQRLQQDRGWAAAYVWWELALLAALGFGLDLERCAATGRSDGLVWVSPRTGRAVSASAGEPFRERLLALPAFLTAEGGAAGGAEVREAAGPRPVPAADLAAGLALTGHFLARCVYAEAGRGLPPARLRLAERLARG